MGSIGQRAPGLSLRPGRLHLMSGSCFLSPCGTKLSLLAPVSQVEGAHGVRSGIRPVVEALVDAAIGLDPAPVVRLLDREPAPAQRSVREPHRTEAEPGALGRPEQLDV